MPVPPNPDIHPDRDRNGVPWCSDSCPQHDGKRCRLLGLRPVSICEPAVVELARLHRSTAPTEPSEADVARVAEYLCSLVRDRRPFPYAVPEHWEDVARAALVAGLDPRRLP